MRKIRLELDGLSVESFATDPAEARFGTVHGAEQASAPNPCIPETFLTCPRRQTNYASCVANCECTNGVRACIAPV